LKKARITLPKMAMAEGENGNDEKKNYLIRGME
jgi:hypothetical protein